MVHKDPLLAELGTELQLLEEGNRLIKLVPTATREHGKITLSGRSCLDFACWDFFDLRQNATLKRRAQEALGAFGISAASSRASGGTFSSHIAAESRLARFLGSESALLFSSRNQAVFSLLTTVLTEQDLLLVPEDISSPAIDAAYLVNAQVKNFNPANPATLAGQLTQAANFRNRIVFLESISQVSGELASLKELLQICQKNAANLVVDESSALGLLGARGAGAAEYYHLGPEVFCLAGDLSSALCGFGGFVAGSAVLCSAILNRSRAFRNEASLPPHLTELLVLSIDQIELELAGRESLDLLGKRLRDGLREISCVEQVSGISAIVAAHFSSARIAREFSRGLLQKQCFTDNFRLDRSLHKGGVVRFLVNRAHNVEDIDRTLDACSQMSSLLAGVV